MFLQRCELYTFIYDNYCFKYLSNEGCSLCTSPNLKECFLNSVINYDLNYIKLYNIEQLIYYNLKNDICVCPNCGYNQEGKIVDANIKNYFKTIIQVFPPKFIFISFDLSNDNDSENTVADSV